MLPTWDDSVPIRAESIFERELPPSDRQRAMQVRSRVAICVAILAILGVVSSRAQAQGENRPLPQDLQFFETRIRPALVAHCYECHSASSKIVRGGLLLDSRDASRKGGESGPAIVPGKARGEPSPPSARSMSHW